MATFIKFLNYKQLGLFNAVSFSNRYNMITFSDIRGARLILQRKPNAATTESLSTEKEYLNQGMLRIDTIDIPQLTLRGEGKLNSDLKKGSNNVYSFTIHLYLDKIVSTTFFEGRGQESFKMEMMLVNL